MIRTEQYHFVSTLHLFRLKASLQKLGICGSYGDRSQCVTYSLNLIAEIGPQEERHTLPRRNAFRSPRLEMVAIARCTKKSLPGAKAVKHILFSC